MNQNKVNCKDSSQILSGQVTEHFYMYYCLLCNYTKFVIVFEETAYKIPLDTRQVRSIKFV